MLQWQQSKTIMVVPKQEQTWSYTGMYKFYIFPSGPSLMKTLVIMSNNDKSNRNLFPNQLLFSIDVVVMDSLK